MLLLTTLLLLLESRHLKAHTHDMENARAENCTRSHTHRERKKKKGASVLSAGVSATPLVFIEPEGKECGRGTY
jgi:hypothetical protein